MKPIKAFLTTLSLWSAVVVGSLIFSSLILVLFPFVVSIDKERHFLHFLAFCWAKSVALCNPWWRFKIDGKEHLAPKGKAVVYVANHQSQADILALFLLSTRFRWLAKASLFQIPIFGWAMRAVGYVPVERGLKTSRERCMRLAARHLKQGTPMIFFPEGTRNSSGSLGKFHSGAFRLAKSLGIEVVPITIQGCATLLPKGSFVPQVSEVTITIHPPLASKNLTLEDLMQLAKDSISSKSSNG